MRPRWHLGVLIGVAMLATPAVAQDLRSTVEAGNTEWNQAFNKGDAGALAKLYTSDAKLLPPADKIVSGEGDPGVLEIVDRCRRHRPQDRDSPVLSAFRASGASARLMPTISCIRRRKSSPAAPRHAGRG
jgi:ketosteroid isomerase-like protein